MRKTFLILAAITAVGCAPAEEEIVADSPAAAAMPAPLSFTDFAGTDGFSARPRDDFLDQRSAHDSFTTH